MLVLLTEVAAHHATIIETGAADALQTFSFGAVACVSALLR